MTDTSFLPEDFLAKKAERRTSLICLILFLVIMGGVVGAFLVTNRQWTFVEAEQARINEEYQQVATQIEELEQLETQKQEMLHKAEMAATLVERVPRSILLSELINRMPNRLSLLSFELESTKVVEERRPISDKETKRMKGAKRGRTKAEAAGEVKKAKPTKYKVELAMVGVAPTDLEVSRYLAELNAYDLLEKVTLEYSEEKLVNERVMREFRIRMRLAGNADARDVEPLIKNRNLNPMGDDMRLAPGATASAND